MTFEQFKSKFMLKLRERGLETTEEEVQKIYIAVNIAQEYQNRQAQRDKRRG